MCVAAMESVGVKQVLGCHLCPHDICVGKDAYNCLVIEWWGCSSLDINYGRSRLIWRWCRVFAMHVRSWVRSSTGANIVYFDFCSIPITFGG